MTSAKRDAYNDTSREALSEMCTEAYHEAYNVDCFRAFAAPLLQATDGVQHVETARERLYERITRLQFETFSPVGNDFSNSPYVHDCVRATRVMLEARSDAMTGFSIARALFDIAQRQARPDLSAAFFADMTHLVRGMFGQVPARLADDLAPHSQMHGRQAAELRSNELDILASRASAFMNKYPCGLDDDAMLRRRDRRDRIMRALGATESDWNNPWWHIENVLRDVDRIRRLLTLTDDESRAISAARKHRIPFGITPFYASLMDDEPHVRDRAIRAQVIPPVDYVEHFAQQRSRSDTNQCSSLDFMLERDTSPVDLITRRYPSIVILKPFNTCPQICVYCQRNWEITDAMMQGALAPKPKLDAAVKWIAEHPNVRDILVTGGDPLAMNDEQLLELLYQLASIDSVHRIRIGTRIPVTLPMRITPELLDRIASLRMPTKREICFVTHVQHPYELNQNLVDAIETIRRRGINVYNQNVFTFYISRRFEASMLREKLRLIGIDPYYTFNTKGKDETTNYRVPIARLLQEQHEEARLMPGMERTDEAVFNVPRLGKNYLRARQQRTLLTIRPDGARVYEWHPWESNICNQTTYVLNDTPILSYLERLRQIGEDTSQYATIWYYY